MNKLVFILVVFLTSNAFALPAMNFKCGGIESVGQKINPIEAVVEYSGWEAVKGYASQTILLTDPTSATEPTSINLQRLRDLSQAHSCVTLTELELQTAPSGYEYFKFEFDFKCAENVPYSILAYCEKK